MSTEKEFSKSRSTPKKVKIEKEKRKSSTLKERDIFVIYWVRILQLLQDRKFAEEVYKMNIPKIKGFDVDYSDYEVRGINLDNFDRELSSYVYNSSIKTIEIKWLLEKMSDPNRQYIRIDTNGNAKRLQITYWGEKALEEIKENKLISGFWEIINHFQKPQGTGKIAEFLKRVGRYDDSELYGILRPVF